MESENFDYRSEKAKYLRKKKIAKTVTIAMMVIFLFITVIRSVMM